MEWFKVATKDTVPVQEGRRVTFGDKELALFNLGEEFAAIDNRCPHKQGPLADGIVAGKAVFCPLHNWKISLETGRALTYGPGCVKVYPTKQLGEDIYVAFHEGRIDEAPENEVHPAGTADTMDIANQ